MKANIEKNLKIKVNENVAVVVEEVVDAMLIDLEEEEEVA